MFSNIPTAPNLNDDAQGALNKYIFTLFYRSPNCTDENTESLAELIRLTENNEVMIGDLNLPCIDWINGTSSQKGESILNAVDYSSLEQLVTLAYNA